MRMYLRGCATMCVSDACHCRDLYFCISVERGELLSSRVLEDGIVVPGALCRSNVTKPPSLSSGRAVLVTWCVPVLIVKLSGRCPCRCVCDVSDGGFPVVTPCAPSTLPQCT